SLVFERLVLGFDHGIDITHDDLRLHGHKALLASQTQLQDLMTPDGFTFGVIEVAAGSLDLAARTGFDRIVHHEGAVSARTQFVLLDQPTGHLTAQAPPTDVLAAQEIRSEEHTSESSHG